MKLWLKNEGGKYMSCSVYSDYTGDTMVDDVRYHNPKIYLDYKELQLSGFVRRGDRFEEKTLFLFTRRPRHRLPKPRAISRKG